MLERNGANKLCDTSLIIVIAAVFWIVSRSIAASRAWWGWRCDKRSEIWILDPWGVPQRHHQIVSIIQRERRQNTSRIQADLSVYFNFFQKSHILKHDLSTEETTEIWYTLSLQPPREQSKSTEEDWISSLALIGSFNSSKVQPFVAALYNGMISVYSPTLQ